MIKEGIMRKDYLFALILTIFGMGVGIALMAFPQYLESIYSPQTVPYWVWTACFYAGVLITVICFLISMMIMFWPSKINPLLNIVGLGGRGGCKSCWQE